MTIIQVVKYGIILLIIGSIVFAIHDNGRRIERGVWLKEQSDYQQALAKDLGEAMQRKADFEQDNLKSIAKAINEKDTAIAQLERDINSAKRLYITAKNQKCSSGNLSAKAESASESILPVGERGTGDVGGIHGEIQSDNKTINDQLVRIYENQERLKIDLRKYVKICQPLVEIVR